jgi:RNA polymerase sigma factor (sigma-70 family)
MLVPREPTLAERLYAPSLVGRLSAKLADRVPRRAIEDVLQQARIEVWQHFAESTPEPSEVERLLFCVAQRRAIDWWRSNRRLALSKREDEDGEAEEPEENAQDDAPEDPAHARTAHASLREVLTAVALDVAHDPQLAQALRDVADKELYGYEYDDIARRRDVPAGRVRKGVFKLREHANEHLADYRALIALAVVALLVALARRSHQDDPAKDHHLPKPDPTVVAPKPPQPTSQDRARRLRSDAKAACESQQFAKCKAALVEARVLDRAGDADPDVKALWLTVTQALPPAAPWDDKNTP